MTATPNVTVDMSNLQLKKSLNISEGVSGSLTTKLVVTSDPKEIGKDVHVKPIAKEKKETSRA